MRSRRPGYTASVLDASPRCPAVPLLPFPRGPVSDHVVRALHGPPRRLGPLPAAEDDPLWGDDSALALYVLYEQHYRGFEGVDDRWEWDPGLLAVRARLEERFEARLGEEVPRRPVAPAGVAAELVRLADGGGGPSLSATCRDDGTLEQMRELAVHRSAYQLKEADPHTWAIPRLRGTAKAALIEIQMDEYGRGEVARMHSELFATTMRALDLDDTYGAYLDRIPGTTLATVNLVSLFGLHRRWRGALVGHLAYFEMCSVTPMSNYAAALRRLGVEAEGVEFYLEHVRADAGHELVALDRMAGGFVDDEPALAADVVFGAAVLDALERAFASQVMGAWGAGRSSLRPPA